jgi:hypothetical protein
MKSLSRLLRLIAPSRHAEWIAAMLIEADTMSTIARWRWQAAAGWLAVQLRFAEWVVPVTALCLAITMIVVDWWWGGFLPALFLIGLSAAVLARGSKASRAFALLVSAGTLPLAHALANAMPPLWPSYQYAPLDGRDWLILLLVAAIGMCAVRLAEVVRALLA